MLDNERDNLLAFAVELDRELAALAREWQIRVTTAREVLQVNPCRRGTRSDGVVRWPCERRSEGVITEYVPPCSSFPNGSCGPAVWSRTSTADCGPTSSCDDNWGGDYLALLQFFLNHRRYLRSEVPGRVKKSPAEVMTGEPHAHWLELLGYTRFSRN